MIDIECLICGKEAEKLNKTFVEGSIVDVCDRCVKFGKKISEPVVYRPITRKIELKESETELIPDYGKMIAKIRENKGLTREEFAKRLSERESIVRRLEEERMIPNEELVKKIENFLGVKLLQRYEEEKKHKGRKVKPELTVGDIAEID